MINNEEQRSFIDILKKELEMKIINFGFLNFFKTTNSSQDMSHIDIYIELKNIKQKLLEQNQKPAQEDRNYQLLEEELKLKNEQIEQFNNRYQKLSEKLKYDYQQKEQLLEKIQTECQQESELLRNELNERQQQICNLQENVEKLTEKYQNLQEETSSNNLISEEREKFRKGQIKKFQEIQAQKEEERLQILEQVANYQKKAEKYDQQEHKLKDLEQKLKELEQKHRENELKKSKVDQIYSEFEEKQLFFEEERSTFTKALEQNNKNIETQQKNIQNLTENLEETNQELENQSNLNKRLQAELQSQQHANQQKGQEVSFYSQENQRLNQLVNDLEENVRKLNENAENKFSQHQLKIKQQIKKDQEEKQQLINEKNEICQLFTQNQKKLQILEIQVLDLETQRDQLQTEITELEQKNAESQGQTAQYESYITMLKADLQRKEENIQKMTKELKDKQKLQQNLKFSSKSQHITSQRLNTIIQKLKQLAKKNDFNGKEITTLSTLKDISIVESDDLEQKLNEMILVLDCMLNFSNSSYLQIKNQKDLEDYKQKYLQQKGELDQLKRENENLLEELHFRDREGQEMNRSHEYFEQNPENSKELLKIYQLLITDEQILNNIEEFSNLQLQINSLEKEKSTLIQVLQNQHCDKIVSNLQDLNGELNILKSKQSELQTQFEEYSFNEKEKVSKLSQQERLISKLKAELRSVKSELDIQKLQNSSSISSVQSNSSFQKYQGKQYDSSKQTLKINNSSREDQKNIKNYEDNEKENIRDKSFNIIKKYYY